MCNLLMHMKAGNKIILLNIQPILKYLILNIDPFFINLFTTHLKLYK